ncbi:diguanylate cyclase domain-containing protein [Vibrio sp. HN007]|uniref:diguanylate cyclase domain-containing protein n=1 Tax=Vibrio iocasae TaxID=3098914 RepID=UPI0035D52B8B
MHEFSGNRLADMADINSQRKGKIVKLFTFTTMLLLAFFGTINLSNGHDITASINLIGSFICLVNLWQIKRKANPSNSSALLTIALLLHAVLNLTYIDGNASHIFWVFPLLVAIIYLNTFKTSLIISIGYCWFTAVYITMGDISTELNLHSLSENRLLVALVVTCSIALISNYYFSKSLSYMQELYRSGIQELAYRDRLTGLANRWTFETWAEKTLEQKRFSGDITALIFLDIDNFKTINDTHGHHIGDQLLKHFAQRLSNCIRSVDRVTNEHEYSIARYAGDEFMILLHDIPSKKDLQNIVHRINTLFSQDALKEDQVSALTFSIGISIFREDADNLDDLIRHADQAMYQAKHTGKDSYRFYQPCIETSALNNSDKTLSLELS